MICRMCEPGKYSNQSNLQSCQRCEVGKYSNQSGSSVCIICPTGIYSNISSSTPFTLATSKETCQVLTEGIISNDQSTGGVMPISVMCGALFPSRCSSSGGVTVYINATGTNDNGMFGPVLIGNYSVSTQMIAGWLSFICPPLAMLGQQVTESTQTMSRA